MMSEPEIELRFYVDGKAHGHYTRAGAAERCAVELYPSEGGDPSDMFSSGKWHGAEALISVTPLARFDLIMILLEGSTMWKNLPLEDDYDSDLEFDPNLYLAEGFRDACLALPAELGVFATAPFDLLKIANQDWRAEQGDAEWYVRTAFTLVYLSESFAGGLSVPQHRDTLPVPGGICVFRSEGKRRW
jgi:hypothetical protein